MSRHKRAHLQYLKENNCFEDDEMRGERLCVKTNAGLEDDPVHLAWCSYHSRVDERTDE